MEPSVSIVVGRPCDDVSPGDVRSIGGHRQSDLNVFDSALKNHISRFDHRPVENHDVFLCAVELRECEQTLVRLRGHRHRDDPFVLQLVPAVMVDIFVFHNHPRNHRLVAHGNNPLQRLGENDLGGLIPWSRGDMQNEVGLGRLRAERPGVAVIGDSDMDLPDASIQPTGVANRFVENAVELAKPPLHAKRRGVDDVIPRHMARDGRCGEYERLWYQRDAVSRNVDQREVTPDIIRRHFYRHDAVVDEDVRVFKADPLQVELDPAHDPEGRLAEVNRGRLIVLTQQDPKIDHFLLERRQTDALDVSRDFGESDGVRRVRSDLELLQPDLLAEEINVGELIRLLICKRHAR
mmetsp:Transcript_67132/g.158400  ORF Transcript_67132/g.158400 Transcript_67132/m.158400 type:complete len:350 (-) Transcript_67132:51-1100(-)